MLIITYLYAIFRLPTSITQPILTFARLPQIPTEPVAISRQRPTPMTSVPMIVLARPLYIPFDHTTTVGLPYSLTRHITICPPTTAEPFDPTIIFGRPIPNPIKIRHQSWLNHYEPLHSYYVQYLSYYTNLN